MPQAPTFLLFATASSAAWRRLACTPGSTAQKAHAVNDVAVTLKRKDAPSFPGAKPEATQLLLNFARPAARHGCRKYPGNPGPRRGHRGAGGEEEGEEEEGTSCVVSTVYII